jgi:AmiR/NasT family two-component response regulator
VSEVESTSLADRLAAISNRLITLRDQTSALSVRAQGAAARSHEVRTEQRVVCNHGQQVQQMQVALDAVEHELEGLRTAMLTRGVIEQAKGMLMLQRHIDADAAFRTLVELSQTSHRKLVEVAEALVREWSTGGHGAP